MNTQKIISVVSIVVLVGIVVFAISGKKNDTINNNVSTTPTEDSFNTTSTENNIVANNNNTVPTENVKSVVISYDGVTFSPKTVTISSGTSVTFTNNSNNSMWIGSDNHPTHTLYPGSDIKNCWNGGTPVFDECKDGKSYTFTFNEIGSWGFHNHLNPRATGTIVVTN